MWNHYAEEKDREYRVWAAEREIQARARAEDSRRLGLRVTADRLGPGLVRAGLKLQRWAARSAQARGPSANLERLT
jgi:hypothetical protein